jgi:adenylate cyclase
MGKEIERKFLIKKEKINFEKLNAINIKQGYIAKTEEKTVVRVRTTETEETKIGYITIKGKNKGSIRDEFEYIIPYNEAKEMLNKFCKKKIEKTRYILIEETNPNHKWEIDVFKGDNEGLIIAEIELKDEREKINIPNWIEKEVTNNSKYYNSNLLEQGIKNGNI